MKFYSRFVLCVLGLAFVMTPLSSPVYAVDYTARSGSDDSGKNKGKDKPSKKVRPDNDGNPLNLKDCSRADLMKIKAFNRRAEDKKEEFEELIAGRDSVTTPDDAKEFTKELEKLQSFYNSDKFAEIEDMYDRCDQVVPMPQEELPFWMPEDTGLESNKVNAI